MLGARRSELIFTYESDNAYVASARCSVCNQEMPAPGRDVTVSWDRVLWFAEHFVVHKREHHRPDESDADHII